MFSPLVFNIWDLNSQEVLLKVKNILNQWSRRKLTLIGRITVIKSLALSKFVHLFISLPAPPNELIKELEKMFYKFLWNSGPDRIKRNYNQKHRICRFKNGGIKVIYKSIKSFMVTKNTTTIRYWWVERISFDKFFGDIFVWWRLCGET